MMEAARRIELTRAAFRRLLLAVLAGVLLGIAARIAMRIIALEANGPVGFSVGGTLEVVAFGVMVGAPAAVAFWLLDRFRTLPPGSGVAAGVLLFLLLALAPPPAARSALAATPDSPVVTGLLFAIAFIVFGLVLDAVRYLVASRA